MVASMKASKRYDICKDLYDEFVANKYCDSQHVHNAIWEAVRNIAMEPPPKRHQAC